MRKNLRKARKEKGLTQQAVADQLNTDVRYYKQIEYGERLGSIEVWDKLEDLFNVNQEKPRACERCKFYMQHYIKSGKQYAKTNSGHCVQGRIKARKPGDTCKYFEFGTHSQEMVNLIGGKK